MKILYIHQYFSTPQGSVGTRSYEFGRRLVAAGHEVTILCGSSHLTDVPDEVDGMQIELINVHTSNRDSLIKRAFGFVLFSFLASWKTLRMDYDVIYATSTPLTVGLPAICAKRLRGKPYVFEVRDLWPELPKAMGIIQNGLAVSFLEWFEGACYRNADACVGLSPGIVEGIRKKRPDGDIVLIPNACDLDVFGRAPNEARAEEPQFTAVFCGAHGRANGLESLVEAGAVLKRRGRDDIRIVFIGDGQKKDGLQRSASEEGIDQCIFLDPMPKTELAEFLSKADLGLMILADIEAFRYGTSPNKFFDYIASGLPVLCNYPGWLTDLIIKHNCGSSVAPVDAEALADALIEYADSPDQCTEQGANARALAESEFGRDALYQRLDTLMNQFKSDG